MLDNLYAWWISLEIVERLVFTVLLFAGIVGLCWSLFAPRKRLPKTFEPSIKQDWRWTGRVNAISDEHTMLREDDDTPADWLIRCEDERVIYDIAGGEVLEKRWRQATRHEVKTVITCYHAWHMQHSVPLDKSAKTYDAYVKKVYDDYTLGKAPPATDLHEVQE